MMRTFYIYIKATANLMNPVSDFNLLGLRAVLIG